MKIAAEEEAKQLQKFEGLIRSIVCKLMRPRARHFEDALQEGRMLAVTAIRSFDPSRGTSLSTWVYRLVYHGLVTQFKYVGCPLGYRAKKHWEAEQSPPETLSLDVLRFDASDEGTWLDCVRSTDKDPEESLMQKQEQEALNRAGAGLDAREIKILAGFARDKSRVETIEEQGLGLTRERVRQIEELALKKLAKKFKEQLKRDLAA